MLQSLRIENFALIDHLEIGFGPGLNVLTGETGAGKSIILDAIDGVLGGKLSSRVIRTSPEQDSARTLIEATFSLTPAITAWLTQAEIDPLDEALVCSRELAIVGGNFRSRSRVNGVLVNRPQLQALRELLVAITAQGQASQLSQASQQRDWLDAFGGPEVLRARQTVLTAYTDYQALRQAQTRHLADEQQRLQQLDLYQFQLQELHQAQLTTADELTHLDDEFRRLNHIEQLQQQADRVYQCLCEQERGLAGVDLVGEAAQRLREMQAYDPEITPLQELVESALSQIETASRQLRYYRDNLEGEPDRLAEVSERLGQLKQITRKYGPTLADAIQYQAKIEQELELLRQSGQTQEELTAQVNAAAATLHQACETLHHLRRQAAASLEAQLITQLHPLAMARVQFQTQFQPCPPSSHGADQVQFLFSPNPGQPLQPLSETASGGEMSRFLLALRACFAAVETVKTLIFDEIDAGVSGRVAQAIAEKLYHLSQAHQVLCVTHQPIVAAMADTHLRVEKQVLEPEQQTVVRLYPLTPDQRATELAQIAGATPDQAALDFATALIAQAQELRQSQAPVKSTRRPSRKKSPA